MAAKSKGLIVGIIIAVIVIAAAALILMKPPAAPETTTPATPTTTPVTTPSETTPVTTPTETTPTPTTTTTTPTPTPTETTTTPVTAAPTTTMPAPTYKILYQDEHTVFADKFCVIETPDYYVVAVEEGAKPDLSKYIKAEKPIILVTYKPDWEKTKPPLNCSAFCGINPGFYRYPPVDALIIKAQEETDPTIREPLYQAIHIASNKLVPIIWFGQYVFVRVYWNWIHGLYYHPTLANRYDLIWEDKNAPVVDIGIGTYKNDPETYVISTIGWPDTFDPAKSYETFGWEIWHEIGDTLVTYWKEETKEVIPDLAVAWCHDKEGTTWFFVIRGGVKAYDPWNDKTYPIDATDVLFSIWRIARLQLDPSWMITEFFDVNASKVMTEEEFNEYLKEHPLIAEYKGKTTEVKSLDELLKFFGYEGETAGVVMFKLYKPYGAVLSILADPFTSILPAEYLLGEKYQEALQAAENGKNPAAWAKYVQPGEDDATHKLMAEKPVGTGPYFVKEYKEDSYIVLERNPYYWNATLWKELEAQGKIVHKYVIYLIQNDANTRIQTFLSGTADRAAIPLERLEYVKGKTLEGWKVVVEEGGIEPIIVFLVLNCQKEPFNNVLVRQALAWAFPYELIAENVYAGYLVPLHGVLPRGFPGYTEFAITNYTYNIEKAKELIKESGIDPSKYTITIFYNQGNTQREKIATYLKQIWGELGFTVVTQPLNWPVLLRKTGKGDFDAYLVGWAPDYLDPDNYAFPLFYGGTEFTTVTLNICKSLSEALSLLG